MKILFVASGNKKVGQVNSFVRSQYDSLAEVGEQMLLYPVVGHGICGYLGNLGCLRRVIQTERPNIVHAHYSTCGFLVWMACIGLRHRPKIFVSLLGSFPKRNLRYRIIRFFLQHVWDGALVKSERTRSQLELLLPVIPNGVNTSVFHPIEDARRKTGFNTERKYIVWCSNPLRTEKNWPLAEQAVALLNESRQKRGEQPAELVPVYDRTPEEVAAFMNAADCLLLTSDTEGSPNVIKEAMACNCPIVTTDVGDVRERLHDLDGCYIVEDNDIRFTSPEKAAPIVAECLEKALAFGNRTHGMERIRQDGLEIGQIAQRIKELYRKL